MKLSKGIEPIIATIIIVAVTLVIAIAVIGWIMNWWGILTSGQEMLQIMPDSTLRTNGSMTLHVKNTGGTTVTIYKVEIYGTNCTATKNISPNVLKPGDDIHISVEPDSICSLVPGTRYTVRIYTNTGSVYISTVVAQ